MGQGAKRITFAGLAAIVALGLSDDARAANGAYAVDAADVGEAGSCKVESWLQAATNTDFTAVANPSCVVDMYKPVELSMQAVRSRATASGATRWRQRPRPISRPPASAEWAWRSTPAARSMR